MHIKKMLLLASMALAAIAFTAPAAAQAQTHGLTDPDGSWLAGGANLTLTSTNLVTHTALGTMTCGKVTLNYEVEKNSDTEVVLKPNTNGATQNATVENCTLHTGGGAGATHTVDITNHAIGTHAASFNTWGTATVQSAFTAKITFSGGGSVTCTYTGAVHIQGKNTTDEVKIGSSPLSGGLCGSASIGGDGTVETKASPYTPVTSHFAAT